jgi:hypothetical protein
MKLLQPVRTILPEVKSSVVHWGEPRRIVMAANFCFSSLGDGRWGRVVGREGAERSVGRGHDVWKEYRFTKFGEGLKRPTNYHSRPTNNELQGLRCS